MVKAKVLPFFPGMCCRCAGPLGNSLPAAKSWVNSSGLRPFVVASLTFPVIYGKAVVCGHMHVMQAKGEVCWLPAALGCCVGQGEQHGDWLFEQ